MGFFVNVLVLLRLLLNLANLLCYLLEVVFVMVVLTLEVCAGSADAHLRAARLCIPCCFFGAAPCEDIVASVSRNPMSFNMNEREVVSESSVRSKWWMMRSC